MLVQTPALGSAKIAGYLPFPTPFLPPTQGPLSGSTENSICIKKGFWRQQLVFLNITSWLHDIPKTHRALRHFFCTESWSPQKERIL